MLARGKGHFDGVEVLADGRVLATAWSDSSVHLFTDSTDRRIIVGLSEPADLGVDTKRGRVAVPLPVAGRVEVWELPRP